MRTTLKKILGGLQRPALSSGITLLIYHRIGGGSTNELDLDSETFARQVEMLSEHDVVSLDDAIDRLERGDSSPCFVLTFDDGFADIYDNAWPILRERRIPFTVYLATAYMGKTMRWEGATATGEPGVGLTWEQLREFVVSGLCTIGNHTHNHVRPEELDAAELDMCTERIRSELGITPAHFTYPWGVAVPAMEEALRTRFRSASTGELGRNLPGVEPMRLRRVPVRRTDPDEFFAAKLSGCLVPERIYAEVVGMTKVFLRLRRRLTMSS